MVGPFHRTLDELEVYQIASRLQLVGPAGVVAVRQGVDDHHRAGALVARDGLVLRDHLHLRGARALRGAPRVLEGLNDEPPTQHCEDAEDMGSMAQGIATAYSYASSGMLRGFVGHH